MTQRARVLRMLQEAGPKGVRSDAFYAAYLPRAGARIHELRSEGYEITSEPERQFVRYKLVGIRAEGSARPRTAEPASLGEAVRENPSAYSGESGVPSPQGPAGEERRVGTAFPRSVPPMFDVDADWDAA